MNMESLGQELARRVKQVVAAALAPIEARLIATETKASALRDEFGAIVQRHVRRAAAPITLRLTTIETSTRAALATVDEQVRALGQSALELVAELETKAAGAGEKAIEFARESADTLAKRLQGLESKAVADDTARSALLAQVEALPAQIKALQDGPVATFEKRLGGLAGKLQAVKDRAPTDLSAIFARLAALEPLADSYKQQIDRLGAALEVVTAAHNVLETRNATLQGEINALKAATNDGEARITLALESIERRVGDARDELRGAVPVALEPIAARVVALESKVLDVGNQVADVADKAVRTNLEPLQARVVVLENRKPERGLRGKAAFPLESFKFAHVEGRRFVVSLQAKDERAECEVLVPGFPLDRGIWRESKYEHGDCVTWGGSLWIAQKDTDAKPQTNDDWRLAVKKGRDGNK